MKHYILIFIATMLTVTQQHCMAQDAKKKFSPEKFQAEMEAFISQEARLTEQEASAYFPLLREMNQKQRALYKQSRKGERPVGDDACAAAIREADRHAIEAKKIEQQYHEKMLKQLSPAKLYDAIRAEGRFHRKMMRGWQHPKGNGVKGKSR